MQMPAFCRAYRAFFSFFAAFSIVFLAIPAELHACRRRVVFTSFEFAAPSVFAAVRCRQQFQIMPKSFFSPPALRAALAGYAVSGRRMTRTAAIFRDQRQSSSGLLVCPAPGIFSSVLLREERKLDGFI